MAERRNAQEQVFLREVDDALREDDALRLFRNYGRPVGAAIVLGLAALAGWMAWTNHVNALAGAKGEALTVALDQVEAGRYDAARSSLDTVAAGSDAGLSASARLVAAGVAADRKDIAKAAGLFAAVATDSAVPQPYRELATVREVALRFDTLPPADVIARLKPLAVPGNPWFGSAGEMTAVALAKLNRKAEAGAMLAGVTRDSGVPNSVRQRARQLAVQLGVDPGPVLPTPGEGAAQ